MLLSSPKIAMVSHELHQILAFKGAGLGYAAGCGAQQRSIRTKVLGGKPGIASGPWPGRFSWNKNRHVTNKTRCFVQKFTILGTSNSNSEVIGDGLFTLSW